MVLISPAGWAGEGGLDPGADARAGQPLPAQHDARRGGRDGRRMRVGGRPGGRAAGSDAFLIELQDVLVIALGDLEPDEQPGQHEERDHDQRSEGDPKGDDDGLHASTVLPA